MIERRVIDSEAAWLEWRKADVTASTVAALFDRHPYTTPLKLYLEKRGVEFPAPDNSVFRRGRWLEPAVAKAVAEKRPDWKLEPARVYLRDPELKLGATPDFFIHGDQRGLLGVAQTKTSAPSVFKREWDEGRELPFWIMLQTLTEMMLSGAAFGVVGVLLVDPFAMDVHLIDVPRHAGAEARIAQAVRAFWLDVAAGREPAADFARDSEAIRAMTAREAAGKSIDLSRHNELRELLDQRSALLARINRYDGRCTEIENEIKLIMGDAERGIGVDGWKLTYKTSERAGYTVAAKTVRTLRITDRRPAAQRPDGGDGEEA